MERYPKWTNSFESHRYILGWLSLLLFNSLMKSTLVQKVCKSHIVGGREERRRQTEFCPGVIWRRRLRSNNNICSLFAFLDRDHSYLDIGYRFNEVVLVSIICLSHSWDHLFVDQETHYVLNSSNLYLKITFFNGHLSLTTDGCHFDIVVFVSKKLDEEERYS